MEIREIVEGHRDQEIRLNHLLSDDLKKHTLSWLPNPGALTMSVSVCVGVFHLASKLLGTTNLAAFSKNKQNEKTGSFCI